MFTLIIPLLSSAAGSPFSLPLSVPSFRLEEENTVGSNKKGAVS